MKFWNCVCFDTVISKSVLDNSGKTMYASEVLIEVQRLFNKNPSGTNSITAEMAVFIVKQRNRLLDNALLR